MFYKVRLNLLGFFFNQSNLAEWFTRMNYRYRHTRSKIIRTGKITTWHFPVSLHSTSSIIFCKVTLPKLPRSQCELVNSPLVADRAVVIQMREQVPLRWKCNTSCPFIALHYGAQISFTADTSGVIVGANWWLKADFLWCFRALRYLVKTVRLWDVFMGVWPSLHKSREPYSCKQRNSNGNMSQVPLSVLSNCLLRNTSAINFRYLWWHLKGMWQYTKIRFINVTVV